MTKGYTKDIVIFLSRVIIAGVNLTQSTLDFSLEFLAISDDARLAKNVSCFCLHLSGSQNMVQDHSMVTKPLLVLC